MCILTGIFFFEKAESFKAFEEGECEVTIGKL